MDGIDYCTKEWHAGTMPGKFDDFLLDAWGPERMARIHEFVPSEVEDVPSEVLSTLCEDVGMPTDKHRYLDNLIYEMVVRSKHKDVIAVGQHVVFYSASNAPIRKLIQTVFDVFETMGHDTDTINKIQLYNAPDRYKSMILAIARDRDDMVRNILRNESDKITLRRNYANSPYLREYVLNNDGQFLRSYVS
jgi:hypothetical protein